MYAISRRLPLDDISSHNNKKTTSSELCLPTCTRLDEIRSRQDKTKCNAMQCKCFPSGSISGKNPDLMIMENHAGTTTTTTNTMERDHVCFCCYHQNHKNLRGRKNKKTFLLDFQKKNCLPTSKAHTKCSAVSLSLSLFLPVSDVSQITSQPLCPC